MPGVPGQSFIAMGEIFGGLLQGGQHGLFVFFFFFLFFSFRGVGGRTGNRRFWPLPGPSQSRGGLGKAPAWAPLDLQRF